MFLPRIIATDIRRDATTVVHPFIHENDSVSLPIGKPLPPGVRCNNADSLLTWMLTTTRCRFERKLHRFIRAAAKFQSPTSRPKTQPISVLRGPVVSALCKHHHIVQYLRCTHRNEASFRCVKRLNPTNRSRTRWSDHAPMVRLSPEPAGDDLNQSNYLFMGSTGRSTGPPVVWRRPCSNFDKAQNEVSG